VHYTDAIKSIFHVTTCRTALKLLEDITEMSRFLMTQWPILFHLMFYAIPQQLHKKVNYWATRHIKNVKKKSRLLTYSKT